MLLNKNPSKEVHFLEDDKNRRQRIVTLDFWIITHSVTVLKKKSFLTNKDCGISCITNLFGHFSVCLYKKQQELEQEFEQELNKN